MLFLSTSRGGRLVVVSLTVVACGARSELRFDRSGPAGVGGEAHPQTGGSNASGGGGGLLGTGGARSPGDSGGAAGSSTAGGNGGTASGGTGATPGAGGWPPGDEVPPPLSDGLWYIKAHNPGTDDHFGIALDLSEQWLVVGASGEDGSGTSVNAPADDAADYSGAAYVYRRTETGGFEQHAYLKASYSDPYDGFGSSVATSLNRIAVAAWAEDGSGRGIDAPVDDAAPLAGAVSLFVHEGDTWREEAYLKGSNTEAGDSFGHRVALSGTLLAVGARLEDSSSAGVNNPPNEESPEAGAVYLFAHDDTLGWRETAYLKSSAPAAHDWFGFDVDVDVDAELVAVGAPGEDSKRGAVYLYRQSGGAWTLEVRLDAGSDSPDEFGSSVALFGDTLVVGAPGDQNPGPGNPNAAPSIDSGAAHVFAHEQGSWTRVAYLKASSGSSEARFGSAVTVEDDTVVVGAYGDDGANANGTSRLTDSGAVYVYERNGDSFVETDVLRSPWRDSEDWWGREVVLSGGALAIGVRGEEGSSPGINGDPTDNGTSRAGAVFVLAP